MQRSRAFILAMGLLALPMCGCPRFPRPEDNLEPNNTTETATELEAGGPVDARVVQGNLDVFKVTAGPGEVLIFTLESQGEEDCAAFTVTGPDENELYADQHFFCGGRDFDAPVAVEGASLDMSAEGIYVLSVPANVAGDYFLSIKELGQVDNIFDFSWLYRLTATTTELAP